MSVDEEQLRKQWFGDDLVKFDITSNFDSQVHVIILKKYANPEKGYLSLGYTHDHYVEPNSVYCWNQHSFP